MIKTENRIYITSAILLFVLLYCSVLILDKFLVDPQETIIIWAMYLFLFFIGIMVFRRKTKKIEIPFIDILLFFIAIFYIGQYIE
jgi:hypothetical protein